MRSRQRFHRGSAIIETGPALFVLFILILFPLIDLLGISAQYGAGWYLNQMVTRELACCREQKLDGGTPAAAVKADFLKTGIGNFLKAEKIQQKVIYTNPPAPDMPSVTCTTTIKATPFIYVPLPFDVPGVSAPLEIQYCCARLREDQRGKGSSSYPTTSSSSPSGIKW